MKIILGVRQLAGLDALSQQGGSILQLPFGAHADFNKGGVKVYS